MVSWGSCVSCSRRIVLLAGLIAVQPIFAATPGFTVKGTNISLSGQGSGVSQFTLTSVGGFTGNVVVKCTGPDPNLLPFVVFPDCSIPLPNVTIPAGGSVGGTINFFPPWTATQASQRRPSQTWPNRPWPASGPLFAVIGLIGLCGRKLLRGRLSTLVGMFCLFLLAGVTGCIGQGGLAMTPGIYTFVISGTGTVSAAANISVTVKCNSCP